MAYGLPRDVATEVFDPAYRELLIEHLEGGGAGLAKVRHRLRILLLFLDCWRLVITGLPSRLLDPPAPKTSLKRRRTFMSVLSMRQALRRLLKERKMGRVDDKGSGSRASRAQAQKPA